MGCVGDKKMWDIEERALRRVVPRGLDALQLHKGNEMNKKNIGEFLF